MNDTNPIHIAVLAGTTREQRQSIKAARFVAKVGESLPDVTITFVDPTQLYFPGDGNDPEGKDSRYTKIVAEADAFFIVTPEYNHSFPGTLKRMLDSELELYIHKPVALAGASSGHWGGVRAVEALVNTVREMGLVVTFSDVYFPNVQDTFKDSDEPNDPHSRDSVINAYTELIWMARTLRYGREHIASKYHGGVAG